MGSDQHGLYIRVSSRDERGSVPRSDVEGGLVGHGGKVGAHLREHLAVRALHLPGKTASQMHVAQRIVVHC